MPARSTARCKASTGCRTRSCPVQAFRSARMAGGAEDQGDGSMKKKNCASAEEHTSGAHNATMHSDGENSHIAARSKFQQANWTRLPHPECAAIPFSTKK